MVDVHEKPALHRYDAGVRHSASAGSRAAGTADDKPVQAPDQNRDPAWQDKIEKAKEARRSAIKARKGKPATFSGRLLLGSRR